MRLRRVLGLVALAILILATPAAAQDAGTPDPEVIERLYTGKAYSPYAQRSFPSNVYWGETHLHTGISLDAGLFGNTLGHEEAYRFARGEEVTSATGLPVKLSRPLDWLVITDHSDMMGFAADLQRGATNILADPKGREWYEGFQQGGQAAGKAAFDLITHFTQMKFPESLANDYSPGSVVYTRVWDEMTKTAERYNEPGRFTALIGFEWTSIPKGNNLHRNVILRDGSPERGAQHPGESEGQGMVRGLYGGWRSCGQGRFRPDHQFHTVHLSQGACQKLRTRRGGLCQGLGEKHRDR